MGYWSLIVPEATENLVPNPSLEAGTTGYSAYSSGTGSGTRTRSTDWQKRGAWGYAIEKTGGGASDHFGVEVACNSPGNFTADDDVTFGVDLNVAAGTTVEIEIEATVGGSPESTTLEVAAGSVGRYEVTHTVSGTATAITARVYITSATGTVTIDGLQVEEKTTATTYCDGTRQGCQWLGAPHNSSSTRSVQSRAGGRAYNLDSYGYYVRETLQIGLPPIRHLVMLQSQLPGDYYRGHGIDSRPLVLTMQPNPDDRADLHSTRKALIDAIKPDLIAQDEPILFRYSGAHASKVIEIQAYYDSGLEFGILDGYVEQVSLRFIAYDPFWYEDGEAGATLLETDSLANAAYVLRRRDGTWEVIDASFPASVVLALAEGINGEIYIGGSFTNAGDANGDYIVQYDPETGALSSLGTGMDGQVNALVVGADGTLYAGGAFSSAGGVANTDYLAAWNGTAWTSIQTGADSSVLALAIAPDGTLYAGGNFTQLDSTAYNRISQMDTSGTWDALGTGLSAACYALAVGGDGTLYAGGGFETAGGVTVNNVGQWDGSAWSAMGSGVNDTVWALAVGPDGSVYVGGIFTQASGNSGFNRITRWGGSDWIPLGDGIETAGGSVRGLGFDGDGMLYVTGSFDMAGDLAVTNLAIWNQSIWWAGAIEVPGGASTTIYAFLNARSGFYIGYNDTGTATISGETTLANTGTRTTYPTITIQRTGGTSAKLQRITNKTTGTTLYFDYNLLDGETVTIDLTPNQRSCQSSMFGNIWRAILQNSNTAAFRLLPGDNEIAVYVAETGTPTVTMTMTWRVIHWSADGVAA